MYAYTRKIILLWLPKWVQGQDNSSLGEGLGPNSSVAHVGRVTGKLTQIHTIFRTVLIKSRLWRSPQWICIRMYLTLDMSMCVRIAMIHFFNPSTRASEVWVIFHLFDVFRLKGEYCPVFAIYLDLSGTLQQRWKLRLLHVVLIAEQWVSLLWRPGQECKQMAWLGIPRMGQFGAMGWRCGSV